jgi:tetratricopeptide (TPR) repeat protein
MSKNRAKADALSAKPVAAAASIPKPVTSGTRKTAARLARLAVVVCLLTIGGAGWMIYRQAVAFSHWRQAAEAINDDDFAAGRSHLEECLRVWPQSGETLFKMARTCRRAGDFDAAREYLKEAARLKWLPQQIRLESALMQAQAGMVRQAEPALRKALLAGNGDETIIFEALVIGCLQIKLLDEAHQWATDWINNFPNDWRGHFWKGRVLEAGLSFDLAAEAYREALEIKPNHAESQWRRGEMLLKRGRYSEALTQFQAFLEKRPGSPAGLLGLARCQRSVETPDVARATVDRLLANDPDLTPALLLRGQLELDNDNPQEALPWLQRAEKQAPFDKDAVQNLAVAYRLLKQDREAAEYEGKKQKIDQDYRRMEELTKQIIENPSDVSLRYEAGSVLVGLGNLREGVPWLLSALLIDHSHEPTRKLLTQCLEKLGDPQLVEAYRRILEKPTDFSERAN